MSHDANPSNGTDRSVTEIEASHGEARGEAARQRRKRVPGNHVRMTGILRGARHIGLFEAEDDTLWRVHADEPLERFIDRRVVIEARVGTADDLHLIWIGLADAPEAP